MFWQENCPILKNWSTKFLLSPIWNFKSVNFFFFFFRHSDYKVVSPALRAVGNIVTGDDIQTQVGAHSVTVGTDSFTLCLHWLMYIKCESCHLICGFMVVIPGNLELFSTTMFTPPPQQSEGVHQKGGMLDCVQHHSRKQGTDPGTGCSPGCSGSSGHGLLFSVCFTDNISSLGRMWLMPTSSQYLLRSFRKQNFVQGRKRHGPSLTPPLGALLHR